MVEKECELRYILSKLGKEPELEFLELSYPETKHEYRIISNGYNEVNFHGNRLVIGNPGSQNHENSIELPGLIITSKPHVSVIYDENKIIVTTDPSRKDLE